MRPVDLGAEFSPEDGWGLESRQVDLVQGLKFVAGTAGTPGSLQVATVGFLGSVREAGTEETRVVAAVSVPCGLAQVGVVSQCWREARRLSRREVTRTPFARFKVQSGVQVSSPFTISFPRQPRSPSEDRGRVVYLRGRWGGQGSSN